MIFSYYLTNIDYRKSLNGFVLKSLALCREIATVPYTFDIISSRLSNALQFGSIKINIPSPTHRYASPPFHVSRCGTGTFQNSPLIRCLDYCNKISKSLTKVDFLKYVYSSKDSDFSRDVYTSTRCVTCVDG